MPATPANSAARAAREAHRQALQQSLGATAEDDFARLSTTYPIVLLPVRIETRFFSASSAELRVRIYPDEVNADAHEPELTDVERDAGNAYWTSGWNPADELAAWQALLGRTTAPRAAWIVQATMPVNIAQRPSQPPSFGTPPAKEGSWTRAVSARLVPDRWIVLCYRGDVVVRRGVTGAVSDPLPLTVSPEIGESDSADLASLTPDGLQIDRDILWTVDFAEAERVGMGARIALTADDLASGFDRVIVVGIKGSLAPLDAATALEQLFASHHYSRGLAFVAQGTPTNNISGQPAGYPPVDPDGTRSFNVERGAALATDGTDAALVANALGIDPATLSHVDGANRTEQQLAAAMNRLLWPVTWGYLFEQVMPQALDSSTVAPLRDYFVASVRGRGPLPAFRIGGTPYGLLPATSLALAAGPLPPPGPAGPGPAAPDALIETRLPDVLRKLLPTWTRAIPQVPRAGRTGDPDRDLLELLALDASAREVWIRRLFGPDFSGNLVQFLGASLDGVTASQGALRDRLGALFGSGAAASRLASALFEELALRFRGSLVSDAPVSETATLDFNYLAWMRPPRPIDDIKFERLPVGVAAPQSLLYRLVRQALLLVYRSVALDLAIAANLAQADERLEPELVQVADGTETRQTVWQHLTQTLPNVTGGSTIGDYLPQAAAQQRVVAGGRVIGGRFTPVHVVPPIVPLAEYAGALETLQNVPTAELERLTGETLDVASHRLDAWITSLAARKLQRLRTATPRGLYIGAFGWVENLRPNRASRLRTVASPDGAQLVEQLASGGFVHAPSLDHAAAAAVLRNAWLTRSGDARTPYAVDLSSTRVRLGRWLLAGVREGQPLTVLLGYRFERALHEAQADRFIEPLRLKFPLSAIADAVSDTPQESIAPRDVVNAVDLRQAWKNNALDLSTITAPPPTSTETTALTAALQSLDDTVDAVTDLLTADAVFQLVRGAHSRAAASLDAMACESRPPEGEIAEAPRRATAVNHRVMLVLGGSPVAPPGWNVVSATPRSTAEPYLDAWLGARLGSPSDVRVRATVPAPTDSAPDASRTVELTLASLGLRPIDLIALAPPSGTTAAVSLTPHADDRAAKGAELERRIADAALAGAPQQGDIAIDFGHDPAWPPTVRSLAETLEIARTLDAVVAAARPLSARDLVAPEYAQALAVDRGTPDNATRAQSASDALNAQIASLSSAIDGVANAPSGSTPDLSPLRQAMKSASLFGLPGSYPAVPQTIFAGAAGRLSARMTAAQRGTQTALDALRSELRRAAAIGISVEPAIVMAGNSTADLTATLIVAQRVADAIAARVDEETRQSRDALLALAGSVRDTLAGRQRAAAAASNPSDVVKAVFGSGLTWLPRFQPARPTELGAAITQGPSLGAAVADTDRWLAQAARVRPGLQRWRRLALLTNATGTGVGHFDLAQMPYADQARWIGLPFGDESDRPSAGRVSLAMFRAAQPAATDAWCGLLIDEWPELIPAREETTGVSFHYDDPGAEAPQTILVAVPPANAPQWDLPTVTAILTETLTLAQIRGVSSELLDEVGHILPAIYLATNPSHDTVSTDFANDKIAGVKIAFSEQ